MSKSTIFFLVLLTIRSPLFPQVAVKNIILLPGKKRDTKIAYHESFKEYCTKKGKYLFHISQENIQENGMNTSH